MRPANFLTKLISFESCAQRRPTNYLNVYWYNSFPFYGKMPKNFFLDKSVVIQIKNVKNKSKDVNKIYSKYFKSFLN